MIAVLLTALGINALLQVPHFLPGWGSDPGLLSAQQAVCAITGLAAGLSAWRYRPWAWIATIAYGVVTGIMITTLGPLLDLNEEARASLPLGALLVLGVCGAFAWYLRRTLAAPRSVA